MDNGREQNYWPGFVDALSNVVLTLVFVIVIFVFALVLASNKVEKKVQEVTQAAEARKVEEKRQAQEVTQAAASAQQVSELQQQLEKVTAELQKMKAQTVDDKTVKPQESLAVSTQNQNRQIEINQAEPPKANQGSVAIKQAEQGIVLSYPLAVADMDDKSSAELGHVLDALKKSEGHVVIILKSIVGREPYSVAQRLAYYRAISARNYLITKGIGNGSNIKSSIVQPPTPEDGRVEITFKKQ